MSETYELEALMKAAGDQAVGTNAQSVMGALKEANKVLSEFQKSVNLLRGMGIFPMLIRVVGKKYGVDAETPLKTEAIAAPTGIHPASTAHESLIIAINGMSPDQLGELAKRMSEPAPAPAPEPIKEKPNESDTANGKPEDTKPDTA